jgi:hypothetical protein
MEGTMGKDVTKNSPKKNQKAAKSSSSSTELTARIDQLEKMLIHTRKKRIGQSIVVWCCTGVIVATCVGFLLTFNNLASNYDTKLLARELQKNSGIVLNSPEFKTMLLDTKKIFLPAYKKALKEELNANSSELRAKAETELNDLKELLVKKIKQNFVAQVSKDFKKIEKDLLKRYPDLNSEKLNEAYEKASVLFAKKLTVSLNHFVDLAINKLAGLDETFRQFKKGSAYKKLNEKSVKEVESLLVESMLELWIYELNPAKGAKQVEAEPKKIVKRNK